MSELSCYYTDDLVNIGDDLVTTCLAGAAKKIGVFQTYRAVVVVGPNCLRTKKGAGRNLKQS